MITQRTPTRLQLSGLCLALTTLASCASLPESNTALDAAHARYNAAQNNPELSTQAAPELQAAAQALRTADQALKAGADTAEVDHLAYMAQQRITLAQETAASRRAEAVTAGAAAERDRLRLSQRTQEADTAEARLRQSRAENERQGSALAAADVEAQLKQARMEQREARMRDLEVQLIALHARKTERGMVVTLSDTLFDTGKATLGVEARRNMGKLADFFMRNPMRRATVEGYTDSVGTIHANQMLSEQRAQAVVDALVALGVPTDRLSTRAFGMAEPVATNDTAAGRQMNRRVEIVFAPQDEDVSTQ